MAFVTSATNSSSGFAASPLTLASVACGTAANTIIIGYIAGNSSTTNALTNMTVNGSSTGVSSQAQETVASDDYVRLFWWTGTGPGTVNITFTWTGDISLTSAGVLVYDGYSGLTNYTSALNLSGTTSPSLTITSATGDLAVAIWVNDPTGSPTGTPGTGVTERIDATVGFQRHLVWEKAGAASVTVDGTTSATIFPTWRFGFSLTAAGGGGGGSTVPLNVLGSNQGTFLARASGR